MFEVSLMKWSLWWKKSNKACHSDFRSSSCLHLFLASQPAAQSLPKFRSVGTQRLMLVHSSPLKQSSHSCIPTARDDPPVYCSRLHRSAPGLCTYSHSTEKWLTPGISLSSSFPWKAEDSPGVSLHTPLACLRAEI